MKLRSPFKVKWLRRAILYSATAVTVLVVVSNGMVYFKSRHYICSTIDELPVCYTAIVPGAMVSSSGKPMRFLKERLDLAIALYRKGKVKRLLLSGDHGRVQYDEVNGMKQYILEHDVNVSDVFLDHAGFDTYNTMVRAKKIFNVADAIVVTQDFHLPRAIYIARSYGLKVYGIRADNPHKDSRLYVQIREVLANVKAFLEVTIRRKPHFGGPPIPITGDSNLSFD
ncbi:MAG TPA: ElyC/SanA/YdcF family protein [Bacteroidales bacterium]|nr:ElyC/SanA/YdcF family protein [Bacteroidales bacterium]